MWRSMSAAIASIGGRPLKAEDMIEYVAETLCQRHCVTDSGAQVRATIGHHLAV